MLEFLFGYSTKVGWFNVFADVSFTVTASIALAFVVYGLYHLGLWLFNLSRSRARPVTRPEVAATIKPEVPTRRPFGPGSRTRSTSPKT